MLSEIYENYRYKIKDMFYDENNNVHNNIDIFKLLFNLKSINTESIYEDVTLKYIKWGDYNLLDDTNGYGNFNVNLEVSFNNIKNSENLNFLKNIFSNEQKIIIDSNSKNDIYNYKNLEIILNTTIYEPTLPYLLEIIKENFQYFNKENISYYINNLDIMKELLNHFPKNDVKIINEYENRNLIYFIKLKKELYNNYLDQYKHIISDIDNIYIKNNDHNLLPGYYNVFKIHY